MDLLNNCRAQYCNLCIYYCNTVKPVQRSHYIQGDCYIQVNSAENIKATENFRKSSGDRNIQGGRYIQGRDIHLQVRLYTLLSIF